MAAPPSSSSRGWLAERLTEKPLTAGRAAWLISLFTLLLTLAAAVVAFLLDREDFPNIGISAWWALQTVTTVGYGDYVPTNSEGRLIGSLVMLGGISFVAVVTAAIAAALVEAARRRRSSIPAEEHPLAPRLEEISARLDRLERAMSQRRSSGPDG